MSELNNVVEARLAAAELGPALAATAQTTADEAQTAANGAQATADEALEAAGSAIPIVLTELGTAQASGGVGIQGTAAQKNMGWLKITIDETDYFVPAWSLAGVTEDLV